MKKITIIGAGLAGTLLSLYLARRGYAVDVYEARSDIRRVADNGGRSINLALSCRGITSLKEIGLGAVDISHRQPQKSTSHCHNRCIIAF